MAKVGFYQRVGGRKAFMALLFFLTSLVLYIIQGLDYIEADITFANLTSFWQWVAGLFVLGNVGAKGANAVREMFKQKGRRS